MKKLAKRPQMALGEWVKSDHFRQYFAGKGPTLPTLRSMIDNKQIDGYTVQRGKHKRYYVFVDSPRAANDDELDRMFAATL